MNTSSPATAGAAGVGEAGQADQFQGVPREKTHFSLDG